MKDERNRIARELTAIKSKFDNHLIYHLNHPNIIQPIAFIYSLDDELACLRLLQNYVNNIRFCDLPFLLNRYNLEIKLAPYFIPNFRCT